MTAHITICGERTVPIGDSTYAVTYPRPLTQDMASRIRRAWDDLMSPARLIILDSGAHLTRLAADNATPIYDQLAAERTA